MTEWLTRVNLESVTGMPEDRYVMTRTWTFADQPTPAERGNIMDLQMTFFSDPFTVGAGTVAGFLGEQIQSGNAHGVDLFQIPVLPNTLFGSPVDSRVGLSAGLLNPGMSSSLPAEVALAISQRGDYGTEPEVAPDGSRPRARRRGRIYIGPLNASTLNLAPGAPGVVRPSTASGDTGLKQVFLGAEQKLYADALAGGWAASVFSRANWSAVPIVEIWVDDAFDTIRSRGVAPSARQSVLIP